MKILKPGEVKPEIPKQETCPKCGCVFEYLQAEVKSNFVIEAKKIGDFITPSRVTYFYVNCPQDGCRKGIEV